MCLPTSKDILGVSLSPTEWILGDNAPQNALKPKQPNIPDPETPPGRQPYREPVPFASLSTGDRQRMIAGVATSARGLTGRASTTGGVVAPSPVMTPVTPVTPTPTTPTPSTPMPPVIPPNIFDTPVRGGGWRPRAGSRL